VGLIRTMHQRLAGTQVAGLPEVIEGIQQKKQQLQEKLFEHRMKPENAPLPYHPETNPQLPDYPGGQPTGTGGFAYNKSEVQHIAGLFNPFDWFNGNNQKDIKKMDEGSDESITNQGKVGNTLMNRKRKLNQLLNER